MTAKTIKIADDELHAHFASEHIDLLTYLLTSYLFTIH